MSRGATLGVAMLLCCCSAAERKPTSPASPAVPAEPPNHENFATTTASASSACPPNVVEELASTDLQSGDDMPFLSLPTTASLECNVEALAIVAKRMDASSHPQVIGEFCSQAATYARFLSPEIREAVVQAYRRFPYEESVFLFYFLGLRENHLDLRKHLEGKVPEDWSFTHPRGNAQTWHYYMYLASLDEPGAYEALAQKLANTQSGNDLTNFLTDFAELDTQKSRDILRIYAHDKRRADGSSGPGMLVSETVKILLLR